GQASQAIVAWHTLILALGQDGWSVTYPTQSICTFKESTVELSCSYTYPSGTVTTAFWYTESGTGKEPEDLGQDPEYAGRLEYHGDKKNGHTLRITDLRESDSAEYKFRFITDQTGGKYIGSPGVTLSVTGTVTFNIVKLTGEERENVTLTCRTNCTLDPITVYSWFKNGQPIPNSNTSSPIYILFSVSSEDTGRFSCAVEGHEDLPSAEETLTVRCKYMGFKSLAWYINIHVLLIFLNVIILICLVKCTDVLYLLNLMSSESQDNIYNNQDVNVFLMVLYQMAQRTPQCQSVPLVK
uniref:Ig-like domain-containing protein n=1 Tax=Oncorhynchus kisutch TaxID=8019 RepID=A0A8C7JCB8_ONCKI